MMAYTFPPSLHPLRDYLKGQGADTRAFVSARQAAFMAQQLLGTRVKFPDKGADMTPALLLIQKAVTEKGMVMTTIPPRDSRDTNTSVRTGKKRKDKSPYANMKKANPDFSPEVFAEGVHIFCDGASIPNPGVGGWGVVVYEDGQELWTAYGGDPETTNNQMELTGLLNAINEAWKLLAEYGEITIWCDSQYCVEGVNVWMKTWKSRGWSKRKLNSPKREDGGIANLDLWKAIDEALKDVPSYGCDLHIKWVKGHDGIAGNERADELAEQGRQQILERQSVELGLLDDVNELDARFRQIMGAV
ncbi:ribonuclease H [Agrobacterium sp. SUL3]|uniref:ribonuclease H family protein n=1 Tax=Agrobacterium sp. SUL3 TaxID=1701910 RepID=UPI000A56E7EF|nr:ribonuclease H [Agrobacterium sp. SUL3]